MSILRAFRAIVLVLVMVAAIWFSVMNGNERVGVDLVWYRAHSAPLVQVLFVALVLGILVGLLLGWAKILELQTRLREARRARGRLEGELTTLRNLPLDDAEETARPGDDS